MNEFTLLGKTVGNIEIKTSESGTKYANLLLDVRRPYKNKEGEYEHDVISLTGFKNAADFLENVSELSILDTVIGLAVALVIGLFIFIIYKKTLTGVLYSGGFALTLVGLSLVTTLVIMAVTSNVVLSLGMVGALSIVRFRTAIKEPV